MQNSCDLLIMNASAVIPRVGIIDDTNIMIEDGKIKSLTNSANDVSASRKIDARGKYIMPGTIDPHVHYGVYTPINEAARTESRSAAVGGVTTMIRMLRLFDDYSNNNISKQLRASKDNHYIDYSIHASILRPDQVRDIPYLMELGISSVKVYMNLGADLNRIHMDLEPYTYGLRDGRVNMTDELMSSIVKECANVHSTILVHAENPVVCSEHMRKAKEMGMAHLEAWSYCRPPYSEAQSIAKISDLGRMWAGSSSSSANLYFVHVGSTAAIDAILAEREKGQSNYYIETCPHYLTHTTDFGNLIGKVTPPIRSKSDLQSMWSALRNGIVDTIGTDHVANRLEMKMGKGDIWSALSGFPGIATMLPVLLSKGVNEDRIGIERVAEVTSYNTARIFGIYPKKGTIQPGSDADLTIVDLDLEKTVTPDLLQSYSDYTIYDGWKLRGWPVMTIVRGNIIMEDGQVANEALGHGEFIPRPVVAIT
ncbi:MAG TPA: amidohydrolase family protein [Nitrososphaeraceae archaeon]|nr:amidohydrolase family protein [Nitrososphaeraceae archaeon]